MITVTKAAAAQIRQAAKESDMENLALRLAVKKDDSGAFEYGMGFDVAKDDDIHITDEDVEIIVSPEYEELLRGMKMDYVEIEPGKFHFIFLNPNDPNFVPPK